VHKIEGKIGFHTHKNRENNYEVFVFNLMVTLQN